MPDPAPLTTTDQLYKNNFYIPNEPPGMNDM